MFCDARIQLKKPVDFVVGDQDQKKHVGKQLQKQLQ